MASLREIERDYPGTHVDLTWDGKTPSATLAIRVEWWAWPGIFRRVLQQNGAPWWAYLLIPWFWYRALTTPPKEAHDA